MSQYKSSKPVPRHFFVPQVFRDGTVDDEWLILDPEIKQRLKDQLTQSFVIVDEEDIPVGSFHESGAVEGSYHIITFNDADDALVEMWLSQS